jgi:hypothetical protein
MRYRPQLCLLAADNCAVVQFDVAKAKAGLFIREFVNFAVCCFGEIEAGAE